MERLTERVKGHVLLKNDTINGQMEAFNKLAAYEDIEEKGKLLKFICENEFNVYCIEDYCDCKFEYNCPLDPFELNKCENNDESCQYEYIKKCIVKRIFKTGMLDEIGKSIFFLKEEAEAKLKEMENETDEENQN